MLTKFDCLMTDLSTFMSQKNETFAKNDSSRLRLVSVVCSM